MDAPGPGRREWVAGSPAFPESNMTRSTPLALALALLCLAPSPAHAGAPDPAIKAQLDSLDMKYEVDSDGDYKLTFDAGEGRSQIVWIRSATDKYGSVKVREIWSPGYKFSGAQLPVAIANRLLEHSHGLILGGWTKQKQFAMLVVKIPVSSTPQQLRDAAESAADAADEIEAELTPGKDDL
jgi:hypothetical protein